MDIWRIIMTYDTPFVAIATSTILRKNNYWDYKENVSVRYRIMNISFASIFTASIQSSFGPLYSEECEENVVRTITATVKDDGNKSYFAMTFDISSSWLFKILQEQNLILQSIGVNKEEFNLVIVSDLASWENDAHRSEVNIIVVAEAWCWYDWNLPWNIIVQCYTICREVSFRCIWSVITLLCISNWDYIPLQLHQIEPWLPVVFLNNRTIKNDLNKIVSSL